MKCLIIDKVYAGIAEELGKYMEVKTADNLPSTKAQVIADIADVDVLIMRVDPKIDQEIIDAAKNLKVIGVCSVGLNHIDMEYAKSKNIQIFNAPGLNANAVAELTISKMLDISRDTFTANHDVKVKHEWDKYKFVGRELRGKTLGIMGFGRIGQRVGHIARAFGMTIVAYDPYLPAHVFGEQEATSVTIPEGITTIENNAFDKCTNLTSVTFAENSKLTTIGEFSFYQCTSLKSIDIPDSVTTIEQQAFNECSSLESVEISKNATKLLESTFFMCTSLKSVIIPDNVTEVGGSVFSGCTNLKSVKIGAGMKEIGAFMFNRCGFTSIVIPKKITIIGAGAFGESKLETVYYTGSEGEWGDISIDYGWDYGRLENATINCNYIGE